MADPTELVTIRNNATLEEQQVQRGALPFFVNQGYEVLTPKGNVSESATAAAKKGD
jgi:hypothetical protein